MKTISKKKIVPFEIPTPLPADKSKSKTIRPRIRNISLLPGDNLFDFIFPVL
jgi:hypothetical protein